MQSGKSTGKIHEILQKIIQLPAQSRSVLKNKLIRNNETRLSQISLNIIEVLDEIDKATISDLNDLNHQLSQLERHIEEELKQTSGRSDKKD